MPATVPTDKKKKFYNRKGFVSQNVMAVCDFDLRFTFVLAGGEGSIHDAKVLKIMATTPELKFPHPPAGSNRDLFSNSLCTSQLQ